MIIAKQSHGEIERFLNIGMIVLREDDDGWILADKNDKDVITDKGIRLKPTLYIPKTFTYLVSQ